LSGTKDAMSSEMLRHCCLHRLSLRKAPLDEHIHVLKSPCGFLERYSEVNSESLISFRPSPRLSPCPSNLYSPYATAPHCSNTIAAQLEHLHLKASEPSSSSDSKPSLGSIKGTQSSGTDSLQKSEERESKKLYCSICGYTGPTKRTCTVGKFCPAHGRLGHFRRSCSWKTCCSSCNHEGHDRADCSRSCVLCGLLDHDTADCEKNALCEFCGLVGDAEKNCFLQHKAVRRHGPDAWLLPGLDRTSNGNMNSSTNGINNEITNGIDSDIANSLDGDTVNGSDSDTIDGSGIDTTVGNTNGSISGDDSGINTDTVPTGLSTVYGARERARIKNDRRQSF
jgi:hypothetical protein